MSKVDNAAALTRARFAMVPLEVMDQWADDKGTVILYLRLWHYAGMDDAAWPSIARLCAECRMHKDAVRRGLRELSEAGWITREDRPGATTVWHVRGECQPPKRKPAGGKTRKGRTRKSTTPPSAEGPPQAGTPPSTEGAPPLPLQRDGTPPSAEVTTPPSTEVTNKNPLTRTQEQERRNPPSPSLRSGDRPPGGSTRTSGQAESGALGDPPSEQPAHSPASNAASAPRRSPGRAPQGLAAGKDTAAPAEAPSRGAKAAAKLPPFAEPVRALLADWWRLRKQRHRAAPQNALTSRSVNALAYAQQRGVLIQFAELAAESGWLSLGFNGHRAFIDNLADDIQAGSHLDRSGSRTVRSAERATSRQSAAADRAIALLTAKPCSNLSTSSTSSPALWSPSLSTRDSPSVG